MLDGHADQFLVLIEVHRRRLTGRADHNDPVRAFVDVEIDQGTETGHVEAPVVMHGRCNCNQASSDHCGTLLGGLSSPKF